ncbi:MAG: LPS export ABC transporter permease LptG [Gammaproteobacteria bacterium]|nr:LPS export ABC transporter permease LptG [Gammaproteobacteria bacterium]
MKILDRYIAAALAAGTLVALLIVVGLDIFFNVITQIDDLGHEKYTLMTLVQYVALVTPQSMYELFPLAALLGSLMGMGELSANSELIAMRASGLSIWRIIRSVLQVGVLMLVVAVFVGEVIAPVAERHGQQLRAAALNLGISFLSSRGMWVRDENLFINARKVLSDNTLAGLTVYEFDDEAHLKVVTEAMEAQYQDGQWILHDVAQSEFTDGRILVRHNEQLAQVSSLTPELLGIVALKTENMSIRDIGQFMSYLEENGLDTRQYRYALWGRFVTPLSALVMLFISVPFVFGSLRSVSAGQRVFIGMLVGFGFYLLSQIVSQVGQVFAINPLLTTLVPGVVFILFGIRAVRRL